MFVHPALSAAPSLPRLALRRAESACELPGVWRADGMEQGPQRTQPSGHALLDAQLPGGGWPLGAMSEILLPAHAFHEWRLVLPALAGAIAAGLPGQVVLVAPPHVPFGPVLVMGGLPAHRVCRIVAGPHQGAQAAWAAEQALRCRDVLAVLAWLPQAAPEVLRRLQLAAAHQGRLLWVFRPEQLRMQASPAPLRLWAQSGGDADVVQVHVLKRRGPPVVVPVLLPACDARLAAVLQAQARRRQAAQEAAQQQWQESQQRLQTLRALGLPIEPSPRHALDRTAPARA
ncbi:MULTISPECIES: translesion DNA synthesis-associated protein ImuA [unclassified Acidovorax]|uniref:translesion DNA synthesis-associated protein ImuA n=1 Tax=unclassified Acidovorax TaxID=2684926 RepID=UPI002882F0BA|nr:MULTISPECIES: translesion DNA synthesis-associated protein ImuA [unclassified Acidovorax]